MRTVVVLCVETRTSRVWRMAGLWRANTATIGPKKTNRVCTAAAWMVKSRVSERTALRPHAHGYFLYFFFKFFLNKYFINLCCFKNEILVTKSNRCCPQCESQMSENCEYFGRIHYNGEMWYTQGCQHCACTSGRVICMNVQCESQFCLRDEIMVKKKDECCIACRRPATCRLDDRSQTLIKVSHYHSLSLKNKLNPLYYCPHWNNCLFRKTKYGYRVRSMTSKSNRPTRRVACASAPSRARSTVLPSRACTLATRRTHVWASQCPTR